MQNELPIQGFKYGYMTYGFQKAAIKVGPLECKGEETPRATCVCTALRAKYGRATAKRLLAFCIEADRKYLNGNSCRILKGKLESL